MVIKKKRIGECKRVKDYSKNKSNLGTYYNVGKLLVEAQGGQKRTKYGNSLIKEYFRRLTQELGKGYPYINLKIYNFQKLSNFGSFGKIFPKLDFLVNLIYFYT